MPPHTYIHLSPFPLLPPSSKSPLINFLLLLLFLLISSNVIPFVKGGHIGQSIPQAIIFRSIQHGQDDYAEVYDTNTSNFRLHHQATYLNLYLPPRQLYMKEQQREQQEDGGDVEEYLYDDDLCTVPSMRDARRIKKRRRITGVNDYESKSFVGPRSSSSGMAKEEEESKQEHYIHLRNTNQVYRSNNIRNKSNNGIRGMQYNNRRHILQTYFHEWWSQPVLEIALLVWNSPNCSLKEKAQNAMKLNQMFEMDITTPRISHILVYGPIETLETTESWNDTNISEEEGHEHYDDFGIHILYIESESVVRLINEMSLLAQIKNWHVDQRFYLTKESFYHFDDALRNPWAFNIIMHSSIYSQLDRWRWLYIIISCILALPILRICCMVFFLDRRLVFNRNERGWIVGFHVERIYFNDFDNDFFDFPIMLDTLTKNQVQQLPVIEYNVSDLKQAVKDYYTAFKRDPWLMGNNHDHLSNLDYVVDDECASCDDNGGDGGSGLRNDASTKGRGDKTTKVQETTDDEEIYQEVKTHTETTANEEDEEQSSESEIESCSFIDRAYSGCTSCHICLADFEQAEDLVVLPRCGHLFHYDCLLPWLTNHKRYCPLCKVDVIQYESEDTASMVVFPPRREGESNGSMF